MVSVQGYINKSKEAAVKANMSKLQTSATEYYLSNGNYDNICANSGGFETIKDAVVKITNQDEGVTPFCIDYPTEPTCENKWLALGKINDSGDIYCVDSFGQMGMTDISITGCMCNLVSDDPSTCSPEFPECESGMICFGGACIDDPSTCSPEFPECESGMFCSGGACIDDPSTCSPECESYETCSENTCIDDPSTCFPECPWHEICSDGACIDDPGTCFPECNLCQECIGGFCYNKCKTSQCDLRFGCFH